MNLLHRHAAADADTHHHHHHDHGDVKRRNLAIALGITVTFMVIEVVGALLTDSLALLADAGHMLTDAIALALALGAGWLAARPATNRRSFGFARAEVLAAAVNAAMLIVISLYIFWEAWRRMTDPPEIESGLMLGVAIAGLIANAVSAFVLSRGGGHTHDLNTRGAFLHVIGDMLGSVGAIAAALVMMATGWWYADPLLSAGIGLLILYGAWRLLKESVDVLMEATPAQVDVAEVREAFVATEGVQGVHDLHIWTVTSGLIALSAHVEVDNSRPWDDLLVDLHRMLGDRFDIGHLTLQPETASRTRGQWNGCSIDTVAGVDDCLTIRRGANPRTEQVHA
ncbi:MAG: cation transporter [Thermomicrobiales bacterium]|nr:cation transporter [Thermomicrobiales bacterium]